MTYAKDWIGFIAPLAQLFGTLVIAGIATWIALQQLVINRRKLASDLFDRRYRVYISLIDGLALVMRDGRVKEEALSKFAQARNEGFFLYDRRIVDYLNEVLDHARRDMIAFSKMYDPSGNAVNHPQRNEAVSEQHGLVLYFLRQLEQDGAPQKFAPALRIVEA